MRWMKYLKSKWDAGQLDGLGNLGFGIVVGSLIEPRIKWEASLNEQLSGSGVLSTRL